MAVENLDVARIFEEIADLLEIKGESFFRIRSYRNALDLDSGSFLAHFNLHLAQSEDFHFREAEQSLDAARQIDAERVALLLGRSNDYDERTAVQDATLKMASVWEAAIGGRSPGEGEARQAGMRTFVRPGRLLNPLAVICGLALLACVILGFLFRGEPAARLCILPAPWQVEPKVSFIARSVPTST